MTLALGQVLRGTVTLADRRTPAAGALVRFEGRTQTTRWVEARPDGTFLVDGAPREAGSLVADGGDRGRASAVVAPGASEPLAIALAPTATLGGRVVDAADGKAIAGIRIVARGEGGEFLARSGADGRYSIRGLSPQAYRLTAEDDRFVPWSRTVRVAAGQGETQDVPLTRGATLVGRVQDAEGRPIEGALVQVSRGGENVFRAFMRSMEGEGAVRTGRDGSFRATRLAPGENQRLDVRHDDYEERSLGGLSLTAGATRSGVTVVLRRGLSLRGVVKDEEGRPLAGAEVTLSSARTIRASRGGVQMSFIGPGNQLRRETGADGRFEFRGLKAGDYTVSARRPGFSRATVDPVNVAEAGAAEPVELVLKPGATISGVLRDKIGAGASGWFVSARVAGQGSSPAFGAGAIRSEEPTGPDGVFFLDGLTAGEAYELQVMGTAGLGPRKAGVVAPAEGVELTVTGTGQVRGRVVDGDGGRAIPDFQLRYQPDAQGGMRFVMRMGPGRGRGPYEKQSFHAEDGSFVLEDVPAGRWTVEAFAPGYQAGSSSGVTVGEGEAAEGVEVRLSRGGVVSGRVLESRTGRPILDAAVRAELSGGEQRMRMVRIGGEGGDNETATDAEGHYEIIGLAPGTWTVTASHPDWSEAATRVELKDAPATADIRLGKGGSVGGTVLAVGRPVAGAQVTLSAAGDTGFRAGAGMMGGSEQSALSDGSGRFRFERLGPGRYTLAAALRDQSSAPAEAVVTGDDAQEVQLVLSEGALIRGIVTGLPDALLAGVNVSAQGQDYFATTRTAAGGTFELAGVPEGLVTLRANAGDFLTGSRSASTTVTIGPGQAEAAAEIVFEQGFRVDGHVTRAGRPVPDAMVMAFARGRQPAQRERPDRRGRRLRARGSRRRPLHDHRRRPGRRPHPPHGGHLRRHHGRPRGSPRTPRGHGRGGGVGAAARRRRRPHRGRGRRDALRQHGHHRQLGPVRLRGPGAAALPGLLPEARVPGGDARAHRGRGERRARRDEAGRGDRPRSPGRHLRDAAAWPVRACARRGRAGRLRRRRVPRQRGPGRGALAEARRLRAAGRILRLRAGEATRRHGAVVGDHPRAHPRRVARDPGGSADARAAGGERAARRGGRPRLHVERLHDGREAPPDQPGAPHRERGPGPLHPRGRGRGEAGGRHPRGDAEYRDAALSLRQVEADEPLERRARRQDGDRTAATRREVPQIPGADRALARLKSDLQEDDVVFVRWHPVWPGPGGDVHLELQDREERFPADRLDPERRSRQDLAVLDLDPIVERQPQASAQESVDQPSGWPQGRQEPGHHHVGVEDPGRGVSHAGSSA